MVAVIPAYNEGGRIGKIVAETLRYVNMVIVVDDGSTDETFDEALRAGALVLKHDRNRGKGVALKTGFSKALETAADIVVTLDGDGQHKPEDIPRIVEPLIRGEVDISVGVRVGKMPPIRWISNKISSGLLRIFHGVKVRDTQSGFRGFTCKALQKIKFSSVGFEAESEILIVAFKLGFRIAEVPIEAMYLPIKKSYWRPHRDIVRFLRVVFRRYRLD